MKTKQSASLGKLTDFTVPPTPDERITALEKRVATLEGLVNDILQQLDRVSTQPREKVKPPPRTSKSPARSPKPPTRSPKPPTSVEMPEGVTAEILAAVEKAVTETQGQQRSAIAKAIALDAKVCGRALSHLCNIKRLRMTTQNDAEGKKRTLFWSEK